MTAQLRDTLVIDKHEYAVVGAKGRGLFEPRRHGLVPVARSTNCYRGYVCRYFIDNYQLILDRLTVNLGHSREGGSCLPSCPEINGVTPVTHQEFFRGEKFKPITPDNATLYRELLDFDTVYQDLHLPMLFSGRMLGGQDLAPEFGAATTTPPAPFFEKVLELTFKAGKFLRMRDVSADMARKRSRWPYSILAGDPHPSGHTGT